MPADATPAAPLTKKPRRRWLRYSLRTLLVFMLLCALAAAWVGREIQKGRDQLAAIRWVEGQGGTLHYAVQTEPTWHQRYLGAWYPVPVIQVDLSPWRMRLPFPAARLGYLKEALREQEQHIDSSYVSVNDITPLAALEDLEVLSLAETEVNDLTPLHGLRKLRFVDLSEAPVDQQQIEALTERRANLLVWQTPTEQNWRRIHNMSVQEEGVEFDYFYSEEPWLCVLEQAPTAQSHFQRLILPESNIYALGGFLFAVDLRRRELLWEYHCSEAVYLLARDDERLILLLETAQQPAEPREQTIVALELATGRELFTTQLPGRVSSPEHWLMQGRTFGCAGYYLLQGSTKNYVLDAQGGTLWEVAGKAVQVIALENQVLIQTTRQLTSFTKQGQQRWSISWETSAEYPAGGFLELPQGDLILYSFDASRPAGQVRDDYSLTVGRLDPEAGDIRWQTTCPAQYPETTNGSYYSPQHRSRRRVDVALHGDELLLASIGGGGTQLDLVNIKDGVLLQAWALPGYRSRGPR